MTRPDRSAFVLLVQADPVVGLDLAGAGDRVGEPVRTAAEAKRWLVRRNPSEAALDLAATDDTEPRLARTLRQRGVRSLICAESGAAGSCLNSTEAPRLTTPAWPRDVVHAMDELAAQAGRTA